MLTKNHKLRKKIFIGVGVGLLVLVLLIVGFFAKLYPVATVGGDLIPYSKWDRAWSVAQKLDPTVTKTQAFNQFLINQQKEFFAYKLNIVNDGSASSELAFYKAGKETAYRQFLNESFSGNESLFKSTVVEPQTYDALLRIKYNSDFAENNDAYNKAQNILNKLALGETFEDLAKQYSADVVSGQLGGDVGFVSEDEVLPEIKHALKAVTLGVVEKNIIVSRQGYHVLFPVETAMKDGQKTWHLKQILIKTEGFEAWLSAQLKSIGTHQLMKI